MVTKLNVWVNAQGIRNLSSLTGSITGLADGFYMTHAYRTSEEATMLLPSDKWRLTREEDKYGPGLLYTQTSVFGLPHGKERLDSRSEEDNVLTLALRLRDGSIRVYKFNVGKEIRYRGWDEHMEFDADLHLELELDLVIILEEPLPDVIPAGDADSGFDVEVEPWSDGGDSIIKV